LESREEEKNESEKLPSGPINFDCNICLEAAKEPVLTTCGHLYCWPCIFKWLDLNPEGTQCPVCKSLVTKEKLIPIYGRGNTDYDPRDNVPSRPSLGTQREEMTNNHHNPMWQELYPNSNIYMQTQFGISLGLPSLFNLQFANYRPPNRPLTPEEARRELIQKFFFYMGFILLMLIFLA